MSAMDVYKIVHQAWSARKRVYNKLTHRFDWDYVGEEIGTPALAASYIWAGV
jgi:hypothetical protein